MAGTHLLERLDSPNGMSRNYTYEPHRDLIATLNDKRGNTAVVNRSYAYNALGIPTNRTIQRQGTTRNDTFTHNDRSELTAATMGADNYAYDYDNIGNRKTAQETSNNFEYEANALNQYTQITENDTDFVPTYDLDGNQTRIKTTTGIWTATYNALNRPVRFENEAAGIVITADYDYMGRRVFKKVETNNTVTSHLRFLYRGYLQIAALDLTRATQNAMWLITWDLTEPVATRPLAIQQSGTWYTYGLDLPKNVTEVYGTNGYIVTAYTYSPYGLVTATGNVTQPIQWSSEYTDTDLGLVYYNYRHYNPLDGRWSGRDLINKITNGQSGEYAYINNDPLQKTDRIGLQAVGWEGGQAGAVISPERYISSNFSSSTSKSPRHVKVRCKCRTTTPKKDYHPKVNGCGAQSGMSFPNSYNLIGPKFDFTRACNNHDRCYGTCNNDKDLCDQTFYNEMKKICLQSMEGLGNDLIMLVECELLAGIYYRGVHLFGDDAYDKAQDEACEWEYRDRYILE